MSKIVNSGKTYFRDAVSANQAADIVKAIVCYVPELNHHAEIPDNSTKPSQVVDTITVKKGAINPHSVVISTPLTAERGNYTFNWVGLLGINDELIAVETYPDQLKYKTEAGITGNTLVKNIVLQFENAAGITAITTNAESWQLDFTSEFLAAQERERLYNQDFLGSAWFWGDAFKVYKYAGKLKIKPGIGYVNGVRIVATGNELNTASDNDIWVEAFNENQVKGTAGRFVIHSRNDTPQGFVDGFNQPHYFFKLADITTGPNIDTDHRAAFDETDLHSLLTHFKNDITTANTNASTAKTVSDRLDTTVGKEADGDNEATGLIKKLSETKTVSDRLDTTVGKEADGDNEATGLMKTVNDLQVFTNDLNNRLLNSYAGAITSDGSNDQLPNGWSVKWGGVSTCTVTHNLDLVRAYDFIPQIKTHHFINDRVAHYEIKLLSDKSFILETYMTNINDNTIIKERVGFYFQLFMLNNTE